MNRPLHSRSRLSAPAKGWALVAGLTLATSGCHPIKRVKHWWQTRHEVSKVEVDYYKGWRCGKVALSPPTGLEAPTILGPCNASFVFHLEDGRKVDCGEEFGCRMQPSQDHPPPEPFPLPATARLQGRTVWLQEHNDAKRSWSLRIDERRGKPRYFPESGKHSWKKPYVLVFDITRQDLRGEEVRLEDQLGDARQRFGRNDDYCARQYESVLVYPVSKPDLPLDPHIAHSPDEVLEVTRICSRNDWGVFALIMDGSFRDCCRKPVDLSERPALDIYLDIPNHDDATYRIRPTSGDNYTVAGVVFHHLHASAAHVD